MTENDDGMKPSNPKDLIGSQKLPLSLVPDTLKAYASVAFAEGASKYGRFNWRVAGVRASIYLDALERHIAKWRNGEECDPATGVPHLSSALACIGIIVDAKACGKLNDDRPPSVDMGSLIPELEQIVKQVYDLNADKNPHQYTIADSLPKEENAYVGVGRDSNGNERYISINEYTSSDGTIKRYPYIGSDKNW